MFTNSMLDFNLRTCRSLGEIEPSATRLEGATLTTQPLSHY